MVGALPDVRQTVGRLDHLARPAMRQLDSRNDRGQPLLETPIAADGVVLLPGLVILAAEDHDVEVPVRLDAEVVVRIARVPPQRVGNRAARHAAGDDVAGVQRELRLKERGAGDPASPTSGLCVAMTTSSQRTVWPATFTARGSSQNSSAAECS